VSCFNIQEFGV